MVKDIFVLLTLSKTLMVMLLCFSFIGQTMASTVMAYQMTYQAMSMMEVNDKTQSSTVTTMGNHCDEMMESAKSHSILNDTSMQVQIAQDKLSQNTDQKKVKCCAESCDCNTGSCSTVTMVLKSVANVNTLNTPSKITSFCSLAQSQRLTSLFKPPIFS
jgi:hypothetical protein